MLNANEARAIQATIGLSAKQELVGEAIQTAARLGQSSVRLDHTQVDGLNFLLEANGFRVSQYLNKVTISWTK